ncbi:MAG: OmcA/MtrC family decaheme c-type cytochrome [Chloroflexota bacterium]
MSRGPGRAVTVGFVLLLLLLAAVFGAQTIAAQSAPGDGLRAEITSVVIPADRKPVATFRLSNAAGAALTLAQMDANSTRLILTRLEKDPASGLTDLVSFTESAVRGADYTLDGAATKPALAAAPQAVVDTTGVFTAQGNGVYTYKFSVALPQNFDADSTLRVGLQATRDTRAWVGNDTFDFKANGQQPAALDSVSNAACNNCHDLITAHGGQRYQTEYCVTCHNPRTIDPESGQTVDMKVMIHKIHRGENLPSVQADNPYYIVGFRQEVHDYSDVALPQDIRNCAACHTGASNNWQTQPSAAACGSCHDSVDFQTGAGHAAGPQPDSACATCHTAEGPEFGASVTGAHTIPERSTQLRGVTFQVLEVKNGQPGQRPTLVFNIKDRQGNPIAPADMSRLGLNLAGPTAEYQFLRSESLLGQVTVVAPDRYEYTLAEPLPANASSAWTISLEGYITSQVMDPNGSPLRGANGAPLAVRDAGFDQSIDFAVTGDTAWPRKQVVAQANCNQCHERIYVHGGNRQNVENCVLCHTSNHTDEVVRPAGQGVPASIDFKVMLHKIHTGEELNQKPYIIYGNRSSVNQFDHVLYPTDRRNCGNCHREQSQLPEYLHVGAQPVVVTQNGAVVSSTPPISAACTACHDSEQAIAHASANVAPGGTETCAVCHGEGQSEAVSQVHAFTLPVVALPR